MKFRALYKLDRKTNRAQATVELWASTLEQAKEKVAGWFGDLKDCIVHPDMGDDVSNAGY